MDTKHTPGPWVVLPLEGSGFKIVPQNDPTFKVCRIEKAITYLMAFDEQAGPDARLIAAAPDMLAALDAIANGHIKVTDEMLGSKEALHVALTQFSQETARAAIAKATGAQ